ncbi:hypothetical protein FHG87_008214 [Trinorchestia longiramus]|nr:hypothetical protein FHG87_008214 [Trinorchestia longiramus]
MDARKFYGREVNEISDTDSEMDSSSESCSGESELEFVPTGSSSNSSNEEPPEDSFENEDEALQEETNGESSADTWIAMNATEFLQQMREAQFLTLEETHHNVGIVEGQSSIAFSPTFYAKWAHRQHHQPTGRFAVPMRSLHVASKYTVEDLSDLYALSTLPHHPQPLFLCPSSPSASFQPFPPFIHPNFTSCLSLTSLFLSLFTPNSTVFLIPCRSYTFSPITLCALTSHPLLPPISMPLALINPFLHTLTLRYELKDWGVSVCVIERGNNIAGTVHIWVRYG